MRVNTNKLYEDILRKYAEEYSTTKMALDAYEKLVNIKFNEKTYAQLEVLQEDNRLAFDKYTDILSVCELQKDEEEELQKIMDTNNEEVLLNTIKMYLEDIGFEREMN